MYPHINIGIFTIGSYGLCMAVAFLLVSISAIRKGRKIGVRPEDVLIIAAFAIGMALFFGNLLYIFVSYPISAILEYIKNGDFSFFEGGIVFYGGLFGGVLGAVLGLRLTDCKFSQLEEIAVPYIPLGHAIGRIGCTLAGCCFGVPYDGIFAIHYPHSLIGLPAEQGYFPVQPLEALLNTGVFLFLLFYSRKKREPFVLLCMYLTIYSVIRFVLEFFRGDKFRGIYFNLSVSQWISIAFATIGISYLLAIAKNKRKHDELRNDTSLLNS